MTSLTLETKLTYEVYPISQTELEVIEISVRADPLEVFKSKHFYILEKAANREQTLSSLYGSVQDQQSFALTRTGIFGRSLKYSIMLENSTWIDCLIKRSKTLKEVQRHSMNNLHPATWEVSFHSLKKQIDDKILRPYFFVRKDGEENKANVPHVLDEHENLVWFDILYFSDVKIDEHTLNQCFINSPIPMIVQEAGRTQNFYIYQVTTEAYVFHQAQDFLTKLYQSQVVDEYTAHADIFTMMNLYVLSLLHLPQTLDKSLSKILELQQLALQDDKEKYPLLNNQLIERMDMDSTWQKIQAIEQASLSEYLSLKLDDKPVQKRQKI